MPTDQCVELPDTYTIQMYDSYGDGWNGNILMIGDMEYTLESGSEGMTNVGCEEEEEIVEEEVCEGTTVSCDNGDWQSEVEWSIIDCDGNTILSGGAPFSECVELPDTYTIQMYDSYGDGWNGNILMIGDIEYTLDSGSEGMTNVGCEAEEEIVEEEEEEIVEEEVCEGTTVFSDGSGGWPYEISWTISNCEGEVIAEGVVPTDQCVELPDTYTIQMYDSYGDGWNGNILMIGDIEYTLDSGSEGMTNVGCETEEEEEIVEEEENGCSVGYIADCNGNCSPENWIQDGICDDGTLADAYFYCEEFDFDGGDCATEEEEMINPWGNIVTDCNMVVLLPEELEITIEGETPTNDFWIAVTDLDGNVYGSALYSGETTSITIWGYSYDLDDEGMLDGESLNWIVLYNGEEVPAYVEYNDSIGSTDGSYYCDGIAGLTTLNATSIVTQNISLAQGWSLWSTYLEPENNSMEVIFNSIVSDVVMIKDQNGNVYWPQFNLNSIGEITNGQGYQIKMDNDNELSIDGLVIPFNSDINLNNGWGIMGYLHQECYNAEDMTYSMMENMIILKDEDGNVYWPEFDINSIGNMCPGEGYRIKTTNSLSFNYPSNVGARYGDIYTERPIHFDEPANTGSNMIIGFPQYAWESTLSIGDEIAAYDEYGRLIGSTVYEGDNLALTVWGDDMTTNEKDGLIEGERIIFRLWNSTNSTEQVLDIKWEEGSGIYSTDAISIAGQIILGNEVTSEKQLVKITDILGKEVNGNEKDVILLYIYDDGSIERIFIKE